MPEMPYASKLCRSMARTLTRFDLISSGWFSLNFVYHFSDTGGAGFARRALNKFAASSTSFLSAGKPQRSNHTTYDTTACSSAALSAVGRPPAPPCLAGRPVVSRAASSRCTQVLPASNNAAAARIDSGFFAAARVCRWPGCREAKVTRAAALALKIAGF